ncbi:hypothetical protein ACFQ08_00185 [Streptosporangium algeriense]|uniref:Uncharacterized protein n=1 Tax=Streptosporangium algeriense TaxID=1682748 RepID=A0ABW3DH05_9ACTN
MNDRITVEALRVNEHTRAMLAEYIGWGSKIEAGEARQWIYNELIEFVNFRMETADTCMQLIEHGKVADALGLCRSLLENYLLFMLICRGRKFFRLEDRTDLTEGRFKNYLAEQQEKLRVEQEAGTAQRLSVEKYSRAKRHLMHVFEGLKAEGVAEIVIPVHYFYFQKFRPEVMRLKRGEYFEYVEYSPDTEKVLQGHQKDAIAVYKHYLSYDALLTCLELNDLADHAAIARIEAHYTFLGQFLHPTNNAARDLHVDSNRHDGKPAIGMVASYSSEARLLAALYVCYLVAGYLDEIAHLHENAPKAYIAEPGTGQLRRLAGEVPKKYSYFWFLFNDPPLYDKFIHCINRATEEEWKIYGHYANAPNDRIMFNQHIYEQLKQALKGWRNARVGTYTPPIQ